MYVPLDAAEISGTNGRAHALRAVIVRIGYKDFLTSNFADSKDIQCTTRTLSRPTLPITMTETTVKAQGGLR